MKGIVQVSRWYISAASHKLFCFFTTVPAKNLYSNETSLQLSQTKQVYILRLLLPINYNVNQYFVILPLNLMTV